VQIPEQIEVIVEIVPHQRLAVVFLVQKPVEEFRYLLRIHRLVQIRRQRGNIDPLAAVIRSALFEALQEDRESLLRIWPQSS
jgi:hypothetical protein